MDVIGLAAEALKPISDEGTIVQQGWYDESLKRLHFPAVPVSTATVT